MEERKIKEKEHANFLRDESSQPSGAAERSTANKKYYSVVRESVDFVEGWLSENCRGKRVLDYCCGNGQMAEKILVRGAAEVVGIDISDVSIENAKKHACGNVLLEKAQFCVMDAEKMSFGDNSFDVVFAGGVLHHLDLDNAYPEIARVLKPDGKCICHESLGHNKLFWLYRKMTPKLRTEWEVDHILLKKDIEKAGEYFDKVEILGFFHLAALGAVPFRNTPIFNMTLRALETLDRALLKLPFVKWQAWQVVFLLSGPRKRA